MKEGEEGEGRLEGTYTYVHSWMIDEDRKEKEGEGDRKPRKRGNQRGREGEDFKPRKRGHQRGREGEDFVRK